MGSGLGLAMGLDHGRPTGQSLEVDLVISAEAFEVNLHAGLFELITILIVIGWLTGRLLGVRRGLLRAVAAGLVGLLAGQMLTTQQLGEHTSFGNPSDLFAHGIGFLGAVLLATMIASVVIEVIFRPTRERSFRIPGPRKWVRAKLATARRIVEVVAIARRHGLIGRRGLTRVTIATPEGARALRATLEDCGGVFVKFGQIAAGRDDFLPRALTVELSRLRSAAKPLPIESVRSVLAAELGAGWMDRFRTFEDQPLASASIGVTHRATLLSGRRVVVKVKRPHIDGIVRRDCSVLLWAARRLERRSRSARSLRIVDLSEELVGAVLEELDFRREAANNATMRRRSRGGVALPEVYGELTTESVLVMQEVAGKPISDADAVDACAVPREILADRLFKDFLDQVLQDGIFHADPHLGNVLVDPEGQLWYVDFGAVGFIDPATLEALQQIAIGFALKDPGMLARAMRGLSGGAVELDIPTLEFDIGQIFGSVDDVGFSPAAIAEVVHVLQRHQVPVPKSLSVLARAAMTMEATLRTLSPGYDMSGATDRLVDRFPHADSPAQSVSDEFLRALPTLRSLPRILEDIAVQARAGHLAVRVERYAGRDKTQVDTWLDQVLWAASSLTGLLISSILLLAAGVTGDAEGAAYLRAIGYVGLTAATAMQLRMIARILQRRGRAPGGQRHLEP